VVLLAVGLDLGVLLLIALLLTAILLDVFLLKRKVVARKLSKSVYSDLPWADTRLTAPYQKEWQKRALHSAKLQVPF